MFCARLNEILLDDILRTLALGCASNSYSVLVTLLNLVRKQVAIIVDHIDSTRADLGLIKCYKRLDSRIQGDTRTLTNHEHIMKQRRRAAGTLDINSTHRAGHDRIVPEHKDVVRPRLTDDTALLEVREVAVLDD